MNIIKSKENLAASHFTVTTEVVDVIKFKQKCNKCGK